MIKVLEEKPVPRATIKCNNCNSLLEYGNGDLHEGIEESSYLTYPVAKYLFFHCPVCGIKVVAKWAKK